jgi:predicted PilT family ATPase
VVETVSPGTEKFKLLAGIGNAAFRALVIKYEALEVNISSISSKEEFVIRGKRNAISSATKELTELLSMEFSRETVDIPTRFHGEIMGHGGANVQKIRTAFSVNLNFPKRDNPADTIITVEGTIENVKSAKAELLKYVREPHVIPVSLEDRQEVMAAMTKKFSDIKIQSNPNGIQFRGDYTELEKVLSFVNEMEATLKASTQVMTVPLQYHGAIIGRSGMNLEKVKGETGCSIFVPKKDENSEQIKLRGTPKAIEDARQIISQMVTRLSADA